MLIQTVSKLKETKQLHLTQFQRKTNFGNVAINSLWKIQIDLREPKHFKSVNNSLVIDKNYIVPSLCTSEFN